MARQLLRKDLVAVGCFEKLRCSDPARRASCLFHIFLRDKPDGVVLGENRFHFSKHGNSSVVNSDCGKVEVCSVTDSWKLSLFSNTRNARASIPLSVEVSGPETSVSLTPPDFPLVGRGLLKDKMPHRTDAELVELTEQIVQLGDTWKRDEITRRRRARSARHLKAL